MKNKEDTIDCECIMYPTREEFLDSIVSGVDLPDDLHQKIFGYEISRQGFAMIALDKLKKAGYREADAKYAKYVSEYMEMEREQMREAARWYLNHQVELKVKTKNREEVEKWRDLNSTQRNNLSKKRKDDLLERTERLKKLL